MDVTDSTGSAATRLVANDLRVAIAQLVRRLRQQSGSSDLTRSQTSVLLRLDSEGPATATSLAAAEGIRPQSMGQIVTALEQAGLIAGSADPHDGRKTILTITDVAHEEFRTGRLAKMDWLTQAIDSTLTADETAQLAASIELLGRLGRAS